MVNTVTVLVGQYQQNKVNTGKLRVPFSSIVKEKKVKETLLNSKKPNFKRKSYRF